MQKNTKKNSCEMLEELVDSFELREGEAEIDIKGNHDELSDKAKALLAHLRSIDEEINESMKDLSSSKNQNKLDEVINTRGKIYDHFVSIEDDREKERFEGAITKLVEAIRKGKKSLDNITLNLNNLPTPFNPEIREDFIEEPQELLVKRDQIGDTNLDNVEVPTNEEVVEIYLKLKDKQRSLKKQKKQVQKDTGIQKQNDPITEKQKDLVQKNKRVKKK